MRQLLFLASLVMMMAVTACGGGSSGGGSSSTLTLPETMRAGFETYAETGGVARPDNAVDVFIVYSPETQQYLPDIIGTFNRASGEGKNPVTGQPYTQDERPIFVRGQQPTTGSSGSVAQGIVNALIAPTSDQVYHPTIFQPSVSNWLEWVNNESGRAVFDSAAAQPTALTPVVIGIWKSLYDALVTSLGDANISWSDLLEVLNSPNGWQDYGIDLGRRAVYYGHADPNVSSTGLSTTIAEYYSCARANGFTERRLSLNAVRSTAVQTCVTDIERLIRHYARSTEDFLEYLQLGPEYLDFVALEETDLICLNLGAQQGDRTCTQPREPLVAIYPEEGTFWHEHPFAIVNADWVTPEQAEGARLFTEYVLQPTQQTRIMAEGFRPANAAVPLAYPFVAENGIDLDQPRAVLDLPSIEVIRAIQQDWATVKKPVDLILLVDISGSMSNEGRLDAARAMITQFVDGLSARSRLGLMSFSDITTVWTPLGILENNRAQLDYYVTCQPSPIPLPITGVSHRCLQPTGSTSLYTATRTAIDILDVTGDPTHIRAVILLSDGQDTCEAEGCSSIEEVVSKIERSRGTTSPVFVIPVAYGTDADSATLEAIARASFTELIQGDPNNIAQLLALLSGYF